MAARVLAVSTELLRRHREGAPYAHERGENTRQLDISYRQPAGVAGGPDGSRGPAGPAGLEVRVAAGDRAPDAPVRAADGREVRLFDLYRGPHATRLVFGACAPDEPHAYAVLRPGASPAAAGYGAYVVDEQGHAFEAYDAQDGTTVLVRPDGYVGRRD